VSCFGVLTMTAFRDFLTARAAVVDRPSVQMFDHVAHENHVVTGSFLTNLQASPTWTSLRDNDASR